MSMIWKEVWKIRNQHQRLFAPNLTVDGPIECYSEPTRELPRFGFFRLYQFHTPSFTSDLSRSHHCLHGKDCIFLESFYDCGFHLVHLCRPLLLSFPDGSPQLYFRFFFFRYSFVSFISSFVLSVLRPLLGKSRVCMGK